MPRGIQKLDLQDFSKLTRDFSLINSVFKDVDFFFNAGFREDMNFLLVDCRFFTFPLKNLLKSLLSVKISHDIKSKVWVFCFGTTTAEYKLEVKPFLIFSS